MNKNFDPRLKYEDYKLILDARAGAFDRHNKAEMDSIAPYFGMGYIETNRTGDIWLTEKGVNVLKAAGCSMQNVVEFLNSYPHMLDLMYAEYTVERNPQRILDAEPAMTVNRAAGLDY